MKNKVCTECGYVGRPIPQLKSSFAVDVGMWLYFAFLTALSQFFPLLLIPLAWTIYHIARFNSVKCPKCESLEMVRMNSKKGKRALNNPNPVIISYSAR